MPRATVTIQIDPHSELGRILADSQDVDVVLDVEGVSYSVNRGDIFRDYDAQRVLDALHRSRGALEGVDTKRLLKDLADQREQGPHESST